MPLSGTKIPLRNLIGGLVESLAQFRPQIFLHYLVQPAKTGCLLFEGGGTMGFLAQLVGQAGVKGLNENGELNKSLCVEWLYIEW